MKIIFEDTSYLGLIWFLKIYNQKVLMQKFLKNLIKLCNSRKRCIEKWEYWDILILTFIITFLDQWSQKDFLLVGSAARSTRIYFGSHYLNIDLKLYAGLIFTLAIFLDLQRGCAIAVKTIWNNKSGLQQW